MSKSLNTVLLGSQTYFQRKMSRAFVIYKGRGFFFLIFGLAGFTSLPSNSAAQVYGNYPPPPNMTYSVTAQSGIGDAGGNTAFNQQTASSLYPKFATCNVGDTVGCNGSGAGGLASAQLLEATKQANGSTDVNPSITLIATAASGLFKDPQGKLAATAGASANASLEYYFDVTTVPNYNPAQPASIVPTTFAGGVTISPTQNQAASGGLTAAASASVTVYDDNGNILFSQSTPGNYSQNLSIVPNQDYEIEYLATVSSGDGATAKAVIDPLLTIDPAYAQNYRINYSQNLLVAPFEPSAAPEPGVWVMMLTGVALIGASLRLRRRRGILALTA